MSFGVEKSGGLDGGSVGRRRRRWSEAQKGQIVAETHEPGVSVPMVAQRYNLNANQIGVSPVSWTVMDLGERGVGCSVRS